jgi:plasmid stabilization system protein ParE
VTVSYHPFFEADVKEARSYYEAEAGLRLAEDFQNEVRATIERIKANPLGFSFVYGPVRRARLQRFRPYSIRYRFISETNTLRILSIIHGARHPDYGKYRR